jgi:hypothetical protein
MAYLTTFLVSQFIHVELLMSVELKNIWKEVTVAHLRTFICRDWESHRNSEESDFLSEILTGQFSIGS